METIHPGKNINYLFLAPVAGAVLLIVFILHYIGYQQYQLQIQENSDHLAEDQLHMTANLGAKYIINYETELLNNLYQSFLEKEEVHSLIINNLLTHEILGVINIQMLPQHNEEIIQPIISGGEKVGEITAVYDRQKRHNSLWRAGLLLIASFLLSAIFIVLSLWFLYRSQFRAHIERSLAEEEDLKCQHRFLESLLESTHNLMLVMTSNGIIQHVNQACTTALGKSSDELINHSIDQIFCPIHRTNSWKLLLDKDENIDEYEPFVCTPVNQDDPVIEWVFTLSTVGTEKLIVGTGTNKDFHNDVQHKLHLAERIFEDSNEALILTDHNEIIRDVNKAFEDATGYSREEVLGQTPRIFKSDHHDGDFYASMWLSLLETGSWSGELWSRRKSGELFPKWMSISAIKNHKGVVTHYIGSFYDITEKKNHEEQLTELAYNDALTGLSNRTYFQRELQKEIQRARLGNKSLALLYMDLDRFKTVNDTYGHNCGDQLLVQVSERINRCMRSTDTVARIGGDEFTILLPDSKSKKKAKKTAERILDEFSTPFDVMGESLEIGISIGIALYPGDGEDDLTLSCKADEAMYFAKQSGRNCMKFWSKMDV